MSTMINPLTNRPIKVGGRVFRQLRNSGHVEGEETKSGRPNGSYKIKVKPESKATSFKKKTQVVQKKVPQQKPMSDKYKKMLKLLEDTEYENSEYSSESSFNLDNLNLDSSSI